jgi:hypothetical protein
MDEKEKGMDLNHLEPEGPAAGQEVHVPEEHGMAEAPAAPKTDVTAEAEHGMTEEPRRPEEGE